VAAGSDGSLLRAAAFDSRLSLDHQLYHANPGAEENAPRHELGTPLSAILG
jgi:hypothetical protein